MAYTPTKTWANGDTLNASDLLNNLDGVKKYAHNIDNAADLKASNWVDTKHIMPGTIDAKTVVTSNASGMFGGQQHSYQSLNYTFLTRWNTTRTASAPKSGLSMNPYVPETHFNLQLGRPASVFYQWWLQAESRKDNYDMTEMTYFFATDAEDPLGGTHKMITQNVARDAGGAAQNVGVNITGVRSFSGFEIVDPTSVVQFAIGLRGRSDVGQCVILSWGVSIEVFYM